MGDLGSGVVLCKMCRKTIRGIPGRPELVMEDVCPDCKAGKSLGPPAPLAPSVLTGPQPAPAPITYAHPTAAVPSTTDLVVDAAARHVADRIIEILKDACAHEADKEKNGG